MKITKNTLQRIIKEEIQKIMEVDLGIQQSMDAYYREKINSGFYGYVLVGETGSPMGNIYSSMEEAEKKAQMFGQMGAFEYTPKRLKVGNIQLSPGSDFGYGLLNNSGVDLPGAPRPKSGDVVTIAGLYSSEEEAREAYDRILADFKAGLVDDSGEFISYDHGLYYDQIANNMSGGLDIIKFKIPRA